ncbi:hypothetical protein V8B55DRAFT_1570631 [Mucor lusitanicus]|uniref:Uncharacterized protein n=2 Tax=Mucor circinelloides f. lusitanicus TaxID=29924 RepID=A0A168JHL5_MUCCL|nr:hypothetical protein FB192DRAFT_1318457 [Mucor lusitanicus]OAD01204.1 hypothetical protein MUCCIDRAFT_84668 [Mucor lusitanicus CBS 277.49]
MKLSIISILLLAISLFSCAFASPLMSTNAVAPDNKSVANVFSLSERSVKYPVRTNDALAARIMANLKANLNTNVFASISADFCEKAAASLKIHANILGGLIKVEDVHVKAIESAAVKNFKTEFDLKLSAKIQAHIYDQLEVGLRKTCGTNRQLDEIKLLDIVTDLESKAKALINVELPKIGVDLGVKVKEELELAVKGVEVNIPLILQIAVDIGINERATLETCIDTALKVCAKLDAKASAKIVLEAL